MKHSVRILPGDSFSNAVETLYIKACSVPDPGVCRLLEEAMEEQAQGPGRHALAIMVDNLRAASASGLPICQDTGTATVFVRLGCQLVFDGATLQELADRGVANAVARGHLRASQVSKPLTHRSNTEDNSPALLHIEQVEGDRAEITVMAKGAGSENVSCCRMLPPHSGEEGVTDFAMECLRRGASRACPPVFLGIGVGGNMERSAFLARKALLRSVGTHNPDLLLDSMEKRITERLNALGIGPQGFGGSTTVLETRIIEEPCHIASLPVTVCVECHVHRVASCVI